MPHPPTLGKCAASKGQCGLSRRPARRALLARAQLDGAVVALLARLRPHRVAPRLQRRGRLGLARGPHRGPGLVPDVPEDVRQDRRAVGEETQLEVGRLVLQRQLLRLPGLDLDLAHGARVHGPVAAFDAIAAARQHQHRRGAAGRDHLRGSRRGARRGRRRARSAPAWRRTGLVASARRPAATLSVRRTTSPGPTRQALARLDAAEPWRSRSRCRAGARNRPAARRTAPPRAGPSARRGRPRRR